MKAIVYHEYGSPDVLELKDIDKPLVEENEVLVRVHAASVNRLDWHLMRGSPYISRLQAGLRKPKDSVLGADVAGQVEAVGKHVTKFQPGDEVFGSLFGHGFGAFAEYVSVSDDLLELKPANLSFDQAAAVPVAALTALQGLRDHGRIEQGQNVLIIGASGGVGTFAVQIAKSFGAEVTGVCSTRNVDMVRSIGADHVIDYTQEDFTQGGQRYDLIFELAGSQFTVGHQARAHLQGDARPHRPWGIGGSLDRTLWSHDQGARLVTVRKPEDGQLHREAELLFGTEQGGSGNSEGAHRGWQDHAGHRQDVFAERDP